MGREKFGAKGTGQFFNKPDVSFWNFFESPNEFHLFFANEKLLEFALKLLVEFPLELPAISYDGINIFQAETY